jgi:outer membrane protein assembly factor BamB
LKPAFSDVPGAHDNAPVTHRHKFELLVLDRRNGRILWQRTLNEEVPREGAHYTASFASPSPVTDGEHLIASFGSHGLYALDLEGNPKWQIDLGDMKALHGHGEGSSPVLHGTTLVVTWDHEGQSFLVAFDKRTGQQRWKVERDEVTSWATPIVVEHEGKAQVIVSGTRRVRGYDLATGKSLWECGGLSANVVASPVAAEGLVIAGSSYEKQAMLAIRLDGAHGDVTGTDQVVWTRTRGTPYVPSPLLYDASLYFLHHYQGILTRLDARTGEDRPGTLRLPGIRNVYASPVAALRWASRRSASTSARACSRSRRDDRPGTASIPRGRSRASDSSNGRKAWASRWPRSASSSISRSTRPPADRRSSVGPRRRSPRSSSRPPSSSACDGP